MSHRIKKSGISIVMKVSLASAGAMLGISLVIVLVWLYNSSLYVYALESKFISPKVVLSAKIDGKIEWLKIKEGDIVNAGQYVARLERKELEQNLSKSHINYQNAEKNLNAMEKLYAQGVIPAKQLEKAQSDYDLSYAQYKIDLARLENAIVITPISGTVISKSADQGEVVKIGAPIVTIADLKDIYLLAYIDEKDISRIKDNQKVYIKTDTYPHKNFLGFVREIATYAENISESSEMFSNRGISKFRVKILMSPADKTVFMPGMSADVRIKVK